MSNEKERRAAKKVKEAWGEVTERPNKKNLQVARDASLELIGIILAGKPEPVPARRSRLIYTTGLGACTRGVVPLELA